MIEHLLDEALVNALRRGSMAMTYADVEHARITEMVGIGQPVRYTEAEQRLIATHEAGHAVTAWLAAPNRTLEVLTIIRRGDALGLLAHGDCEEVWTHSHYDLRALVQIAMGGWVAEELFFGQTSTGPAGDLAVGDADRRADGRRGRHDRVAHLVRRHAARPGLRGAQRRAGPRPAGGGPRRRPQHGPSAAVPAPPPGRGAAGRAARAARAHRRRDHRGARGRDARPAAAAGARGATRRARAVGRAVRQPRPPSRRSGCGWLSLRGVPEGHTVHRIARQLTQDLVGRRLAVSSPQGRFAAGAARLDGQVLVSADAVGKQLFCTFERGDVLRVHLGLYGAWDFYGSLTPLVPGGVRGGQHGGSAAAPGGPDGGGRAGARRRRGVPAASPWGRSASGWPPTRRWPTCAGPSACEVLDPAGAAAAIERLGPDPASTDDLGRGR